MLKKIGKQKSDFAYILAGTIMLMVIPLYNGYPLVYSDTGTYLYSGFDLFVPFDRPATYGLFVRFTSLKTSLWLTALVQSILSAWVLWLSAKRLLPDTLRYKSYLLLMAILTFFSGIGWYSGQIMPDFFAPIAILSLILVLIHPKSEPRGLIVPSILLLISLICHFSHLLIIIAMLLIIGPLTWLMRNEMKTHLLKITLKRYSLAAAIIISAWLITPLIHFKLEGRFVISKGSHAFLMAHMADAGILQKFLNENCAKEGYSAYSLCSLKEKIPNDLATFLWESGGVFEQSGGWEHSKTEYDIILNEMFNTPSYLALIIKTSAIYGLSQLFHYQIGDGLSAYNEGSAPYGQIHWRFSDELNMYLNARQQKFDGLNLNFSSLNNWHLIALISCCLFWIWKLMQPTYSQTDALIRLSFIMIIAGLIANAMITGGIVAPCPRFQARVNGLLIFISGIALIETWSNRKIY